ncbi:MAG: TIGR03619 family F420-dependent LLM class oxidoreductase [Novosphingobium sp.]|nr:TIGR03619 family F420-dependent LLM class oxidoreductase [Novosphingobium sp.]
MELAFSMPHLVELKALMQPWERQVQGADQTSLAKWAEQLGYTMICVPEHHIIPRDHVELSGPFYFNSYAGMAYFAGATERIRVNSCISILPLQNSIVSAKALSTIDWMSSGRAMVTFAAGWLEEEFAILGVPFHERGAMCEEYLAAIIELWTKDDPVFEGKYVSFRDVAFEPKPVQKPHLPIWLGGDADPVLRRCGRYCSGWWPFLTKPEAIPDKIDYIKSQPDYAGKLEDVFYGFATTRVGEGHVVLDDPKVRPGMTKNEIIDRLGWFKTLGVTMSGLPVPPVRGIDEYRDYTQWVAEEIMPAVR